jgi:hypothetical protein
VGELREERGDEIEFVIVPAEETAARAEELEYFHLMSRKHGLVAFDAFGEPVLTIAGHSYGRPEIEMAIRQIAGN